MSSYLLPRPFEYDTKRFRSSLRIFGMAVIALAAVGMLMRFFAAGSMVAVYIFMIAALFLMVWMLVVPLPHLSTKHNVTGDSVVLRQGLGFTLSIPFDNIAGIKSKQTSSRPGIRVDRSEGTLYVIAAGPGNVRITLRDPQTVKHGAFDCVIFDVKEPREFVSCVKERRKGESLMRSLEEEPLPKKASAPKQEPPEREADAVEAEIVEEEPSERQAPMRKRVVEDEPPRPRQPDRVARIVRVAKGK